MTAGEVPKGADAPSNDRNARAVTSQLPMKKRWVDDPWCNLTGRKLPKIAPDIESQIISARGSQRSIAAAFGVSQRTVGRIRRTAIAAMEVPK